MIELKYYFSGYLLFLHLIRRAYRLHQLFNLQPWTSLRQQPTRGDVDLFRVLILILLFNYCMRQNSSPLST
jgi:hypothetical protein